MRPPWFASVLGATRPDGRSQMGTGTRQLSCPCYNADLAQVANKVSVAPTHRSAQKIPLWHAGHDRLCGVPTAGRRADMILEVARDSAEQPGTGQLRRPSRPTPSRTGFGCLGALHSSTCFQRRAHIVPRLLASRAVPRAPPLTCAPPLQLPNPPSRCPFSLSIPCSLAWSSR